VILTIGYSRRITIRFAEQLLVVSGKARVAHYPFPNPECDEIRRHVRHPDRVYYFSIFDFHYYMTCGQTPVGYYQPLLANNSRAKLVSLLRELLQKGYEIVVPIREMGLYRANIGPALGLIHESQSAHYFFVKAI
jgi:hypothetical protein